MDPAAQLLSPFFRRPMQHRIGRAATELIAEPAHAHAAAVEVGQRQAVGLARAVLANPSVMLLDEPTSAMDNATEAMAMGALARLCAGKTMIYVTHKLQLLDYVTRVVILDAGTRVADGPKEAVLQALKEGKIQGARRG